MLVRLRSIGFYRFRWMKLTIAVSTSECASKTLTIAGASVSKYDCSTFMAKLSVIGTS